MGFGEDVFSAIHGKSQYPQLHRVYKNRHKAGVRKLSRCADKFNVKRTQRGKGRTERVRTDSRKFQFDTKHNDFPYVGMTWNRRDREEGMGSFLVDCCPYLIKRFIIYGTIGRGSKCFLLERPLFKLV